MREHGLHQPPSDVVGVTTVGVIVVGVIVVGVTVIRYREPPDPLLLTVPAAPENLATVRDHLRRWLTLTGVDTESSADAVLAVGEAASNAAEHAATGARRNVDLTITAAVSDGRLRFTVSDNGCWRTPPPVSGNRGHGIRLIRALVDEVELITTAQGTTVTMVKKYGVKEMRGSREHRHD